MMSIYDYIFVYNEQDQNWLIIYVTRSSTLWSPSGFSQYLFLTQACLIKEKQKEIIESINFWTKKTTSSVEQGFSFLLLEFSKLLGGIVVFHCCLMMRWQPPLLLSHGPQVGHIYGPFYVLFCVLFAFSTMKLVTGTINTMKHSS